MQSEIGTYYDANGSSAMDLISDVKGTSSAGCYGAFPLRSGFEMPYHVWKGGMVDEFGGGEGHFLLDIDKAVSLLQSFDVDILSVKVRF